MSYDVQEFSAWSAAARKLERKWEIDVPEVIRKRGYVRFFDIPVGDYTFCTITNRSGSKTYGCGWAKRVHSDFYDLHVAQKVSFNRALEDIFSYLGYEQLDVGGKVVPQFL